MRQMQRCLVQSPPAHAARPRNPDRDRAAPRAGTPGTAVVKIARVVFIDICFCCEKNMQRFLVQSKAPDVAPAAILRRASPLQIGNNSQLLDVGLSFQIRTA